MALIEKDYGVEKKGVVDSVRAYKLDRYHAFYYLVLKK